MASTRSAILAASKAMPGGGRPNPGPQQMQGPYVGQMSPLVQQLGNERGYCLAPETRVLCPDFLWHPVGSLIPGDDVIAFDEKPEPGRRRHMHIATVLATPRLVRPSHRVRFTNGREVVASAEHMWLSPDSRWMLTRNLCPGREVMYLGAPWDGPDTSWESGWLAGAFDGEANLSPRGGKSAGCGWYLNFTQKSGGVLDHAEQLLKEKGYEVRPEVNDLAKDMYRLCVTGMYDCFRFLGECRPVRLLAKAPAWLEGTSYARSRGTVRSREYVAIVESVEFLGDREVVGIATSTRTLFAEGLFSHNSNLYGGFLPRPPRDVH